MGHGFPETHPSTRRAESPAARDLSWRLADGGPLFLITTAAGHRSRPPQPAIAAGHRGPGLTAYLALGS
ncbi:MAG: hypothetical protein KBF43_09700 [Dermatophilaceae bacterium]|nr:hypothetical protein [Dermatophilaceae bacterium]MBP9918845.1 hypothetical protein [Dermatophilaceae bacterium]